MASQDMSTHIRQWHTQSEVLSQRAELVWQTLLRKHKVKHPSTLSALTADLDNESGPTEECVPRQNNKINETDLRAHRSSMTMGPLTQQQNDNLVDTSSRTSPKERETRSEDARPMPMTHINSDSVLDFGSQPPAAQRSPQGGSLACSPQCSEMISKSVDAHHARKYNDIQSETPEASSFHFSDINWEKQKTLPVSTTISEKHKGLKTLKTLREKRSAERKRQKETEADHSLNAIEKIMKKKEAKGSAPERKRPKFTVPGKQSEPRVIMKGEHSSDAQAGIEKCHQSPLKSVDQLSGLDRDKIEKDVMNAEEIIITLIYTDGSTQLRPLEEVGRKKSSPSVLEGVAVLYPIKCTEEGAEKADQIFFPVKTVNEISRDFLRKIMGSKSRKICFNAYFFIVTMMESYGFTDQEVISTWTILDPALAHWLLDSDHPVKIFKDLLKSVPELIQVSSQNTFAHAHLVEDMKLLGPLMAHLYQRLRRTNLWLIFLHLETPLMPILAAMHVRGMKADSRQLIKMGNILERKLNQLEEDAHMSACKRFSLSSHAQLRQILFEDLQLDKKLPSGSKIPKTNVGGQKSTSEPVLHLLKDTHPLPSIVLEHRQLQKLKSTYVDGMLAGIRNGWLHTHWDQISAATGRLASTQPNIQAVPKQPVHIALQTKTIIGKDPETVVLNARDPFISKEGYVFLSADFQQIEFRLLAHLSADPIILEVFKDKNTDIFIQLTAQWLGKAVSDVTPAEREQAKRVVYSVMYGVGKERLSDYLKISQEKAKNIIQSFLVTYPGINAYTKSCVEEARKNGYQRTLFGRRRLLPHLSHPAPQLRAQAERQAVNFCVQGSAADICKIAMVQMERALASRQDLDARILVQIHDELLFEVRADQLDQVAELAESMMEDRETLCGRTVELTVPLRICLATGTKWGQLQPYKKIQDDL